ncbi:MAG: hypothetical protein R2875_13790 [Desulfobacterales bacterium]
MADAISDAVLDAIMEQGQKMPGGL